MNNIYEAISGSSVALIGMCKNSGKTTVLNKILELMPDGVITALTSIGRDGEEVDLVTRTPKPRIFVRPGTIFATAKNLLAVSDVTLEILRSTGFSSPLGEIFVVRALSGGFVQLSGPSMTEQMLDLKKALINLADKIIIDGALSRKSLSIPTLCDCCVLCAGAACSPSMEKVVEETAHAAGLLNTEVLPDQKALDILHENSEKRLILIDKNYTISTFFTETNLAPAALCECLTPDTRIIFAAGAVTDAFVRNLPPEISLVASDASKLLLSKRAVDKLRQKRIRLFVLNKINLAAVCINPVSPDGNNFDKGLFLERMQGAVRQPVFDVKQCV